MPDVTAASFMPNVKLPYFSERWILASSAYVKKPDTRTFCGAPRIA
jgi:hypothetical protein